ncbi:hypothetical protein Fcan01_10143 [Folsomia candida]|uniref:Uncharacterized protein n=1 Tax=Folsomia candida TaxID=158441 RepID=A0A226E7D5_FOLCA|nr:hypothetical protein Fcan01_10143 [Folsomia candida]
MKPYQTETVRLFNRLYNAKPFFWYGLPMQLTTNGDNLHIKKSGKLAHTIIPIVLAFVGIIYMGFATFVRMTSPVITSIGRFIIMAYQWIILMHGIYFFLFVMDLLGYSDIMIQLCNLSDQYVEQLGRAVPAQSKILCRPDLLNYTLRLFVWAGIILPPPMVLIFVLLGMGPSETLATFIVSKSPWLHTWLPPPVMAVLKLAGFMASYFGFVISTMDLFRCFILLAIVALMAAQFCKSLVDLAEAYFDCVQSLGQQVGMQHFSIFNRIAATINKLGSLFDISIISHAFLYVLVA